MAYVRMQRNSTPLWMRGITYTVTIANAAVKDHVDNKPTDPTKFANWFEQLGEIREQFGDAWDQYQRAPIKNDKGYVRSIALSKFRAFLETTTQWEQFDAIYPVVYWGGSHVVGMKGKDAFLICSVSKEWVIAPLDDPEEAEIIDSYQNRELDH